MDCSFRRARPFVFYRFLTGLRRPRRRILGSELAGEVEAVGAAVDRCYPLEQVVEATRYVETEQKTGNVVLTTVTFPHPGSSVQ